jgi:hypothetical protein
LDSKSPTFSIEQNLHSSPRAKSICKSTLATIIFKPNRNAKNYRLEGQEHGQMLCLFKEYDLDQRGDEIPPLRISIFRFENGNGAHRRVIAESSRIDFSRANFHISVFWGASAILDIFPNFFSN